MRIPEAATNQNKDRKILIVALGLMVTITCLYLLLYHLGMRINVTPSCPIGIWMINQNYETIQKGDFLWIAQSNATDVGVERGYFNANTPLLKQVYGLAGDSYFFNDNQVLINNAPLPGMIRQDFDSTGSPMPKLLGGRVPTGYFFVLNKHPKSFDSRYFGPIPGNTVIGTATPVAVW